MYPTNPFSPSSLCPNSFDLLTTNGIINEDLTGYITGTPSPYLQNYIAAQKGAAPTQPNQALPVTLPGVTPKNSLTNDIFVKLNSAKDGIPFWKKIAAGTLLGGLTILLAMKGKNIVSKVKSLIHP